MKKRENEFNYFEILGLQPNEDTTDEQLQEVYNKKRESIKEELQIILEQKKMEHSMELINKKYALSIQLFAVEEAYRNLCDYRTSGRWEDECRKAQEKIQKLEQEKSAKEKMIEKPIKQEENLHKNAMRKFKKELEFTPIYHGEIGKVAPINKEIKNLDKSYDD